MGGIISLYGHYVIVTCEISCVQMNNICYQRTRHLQKQGNPCQLQSSNARSLERNQYALFHLHQMHKGKGRCFQEPRLAFWCSWLKVIGESAWEFPSQSVVARISLQGCHIETNRDRKLVVRRKGSISKPFLFSSL